MISSFSFYLPSSSGIIITSTIAAVSTRAGISISPWRWTGIIPGWIVTPWSIISFWRSIISVRRFICIWCSIYIRCIVPIFSFYIIFSCFILPRIVIPVDNRIFLFCILLSFSINSSIICLFTSISFYISILVYSCIFIS